MSLSPFHVWLPSQSAILMTSHDKHNSLTTVWSSTVTVFFRNKQEAHDRHNHASRSLFFKFTLTLLKNEKQLLLFYLLWLQLELQSPKTKKHTDSSHLLGLRPPPSPRTSPAVHPRTQWRRSGTSGTQLEPVRCVKCWCWPLLAWLRSSPPRPALLLRASH